MILSRMLATDLFLATLTSVAIQPAFAQETQATPRAVVREDTSPHDFQTTLSRLKAQVARDGWTLLAEIDLGQRIAKKGVHLPGGLVILELSSGGNTIPLLKDQSTRYIAGLMPCGVSVYGLDDGRVVVSRTNADLLAGMMEPRVAQVMQASATKLDQTIARALMTDN